MPIRQSVKTVQTPELQGDDSWVKLRRLTLGESLDLDKEQRKLAREGLSELSPEERLEYARVGLKVVAQCILDWNWVDDEGVPLPKPSDDPLVVERLTDQEIVFLTGFFQVEDKDKLKNSTTG